jgi:hypothetical protein
VGGLLRFLAWFALLVAGFVLVALPLLMGPLLAGVVRDMGVRADTINVSVALFDPGLVLGRSRQVTLSATNVDLAPARIGSFRLTLGGVSFFDRTFDTVSGELDNVQLTLGKDAVSADSATVEGPADAATVTATFAAAQVAQLLTVAAAHNGLKLDNVAVTESGVSVTAHGVEASAQLSVIGGALLLHSGQGGTIVLLQPGRNDPWSLTDAWFSARGLNLSGTVDVATIVHDLPTGG